MERGPIRSLISTNGKVEPIQNFEAHAPVATTVKRLLVKEGDHVRKGQLLLQLDDADVRSQAARAQAQMKAAQADRVELKTGGTREEVLTLDAQLMKARSAPRSRPAQSGRVPPSCSSRAQPPRGKSSRPKTPCSVPRPTSLCSSRKRKTATRSPKSPKFRRKAPKPRPPMTPPKMLWSKCSVRAPFDGIVYSLPVKQGAYVQTGDLLLQEGDLSQMLVRTFVDEPDIGRLPTGQKIEVILGRRSRAQSGKAQSAPYPPP